LDKRLEFELKDEHMIRNGFMNALIDSLATLTLLLLIYVVFFHLPLTCPDVEDVLVLNMASPRRLE
jgi:hypothetical protein